jgi:hypothetical protein
MAALNRVFLSTWNRRPLKSRPGLPATVAGTANANDAGGRGERLTDALWRREVAQIVAAGLGQQVLKWCGVHGGS